MFRVLTPSVWGSPWTAARPSWRRIWWSPVGSVGASAGGFYYKCPPWQPWFAVYYQFRYRSPEREATASPWSVTVSLREGKQTETDAKRSRQQRGAYRQSPYSAHWKNRRMEEKRQMRTEWTYFRRVYFTVKSFCWFFFLSSTFNPFYMVYSYSDLFLSGSFNSRNVKFIYTGL